MPVLRLARVERERVHPQHAVADLIDRFEFLVDQSAALVPRLFPAECQGGAQFVTGADRLSPAESIESGRPGGAGLLEGPLDEQAHRERNRVPTARDQSTERAVWVVLQMELLWVVPLCERAYLLARDLATPEFDCLAGRYRLVERFPVVGFIPPLKGWAFASLPL